MYYSEAEALYYDKYKGHFSKKLADWAVSCMAKKDSTGNLTPIKMYDVEEFDEFIKTNKLEVANECYYDAYYLYHMAMADYTNTLETKAKIASYIDETINDPDCESTAVLACFRAKMDVMGVPIFWEKYL